MLIGIPGVPGSCECPVGRGPQPVGFTEGRGWRTLVNLWEWVKRDYIAVVALVNSSNCSCSPRKLKGKMPKCFL